MSRNEGTGRVSRAFEEWRLVDEDIRAYVKFALRISEEAYDRIWNEAAAEPAWDESADLPDVFHERVDGVWPNDFEWMLFSGALKEAVTACEVYLEKVMEEVLRFHGFTLAHFTDHRSLSWDSLNDFFKEALGVNLKEDQGLRHVRDLRHILTHKRGELRTDHLRNRFGRKDDGRLGLDVHLTLTGTVEAMEVLGRAVRRVDEVSYAATWGGSSPPGLHSYIQSHTSQDS